MAAPGRNDCDFCGAKTGHYRGCPTQCPHCRFHAGPADVIEHIRNEHPDTLQGFPMERYR